MSTGGVSSEDGKTLRAMAVVQALRPAGTDTRADADRVNVVRLFEALGPISPELVLVDPELAPRARALLPELAWNWRPRAREFEEPISPGVAAVPPAMTFRRRLAAEAAAITSRWRLAAVPAAMTSRRMLVAASAAITSRWRLAAVPAAMTSRWRLAAVAAAMTSRWRLAAVSALVAVGAVAFGLGISVATTDREDLRAVQSRPPLAAPARQPNGGSPAPRAAPKKAGPPAAVKKAGSQRPVVAPPRFVWPIEARATGYRVALYLKGRQIFEQDVRTTALQLPQSWTYKGSFYGLTKGTYRWVVWPLVGSGANVRRGPAIVSARYTV